jgi:hypothetical protein
MMANGFMMKLLRKPLVHILVPGAVLFLLINPIISWAETPVPETPQDEKPESPWLITPLISSGPKFGTSLGAMAGYLHNFDDESPASMFGVMASYSNTESTVYGAFARTFFDQDRQRLIAGAVTGEVNNEYADFLGSGFEFKTTDNIHALFSRYLYRIKDDWFIGPQALSTDYAISGSDWFSDAILDRIGLTGFDSNGLGLVVERDTRDNQNSPSTGSRFNINNVAYRQSFGGDVSFDAYALSFSKYTSHGNGHVLAGRVNGRWTNNAPPSGYSTIMLRGYTMGQFLARHSTLFEIEERLHIKGRWGATAFLGAACLYGDGESCDERTNWYPAAGAGITFMLKPEEKMIARAELATGKGENFGFYMKFGYEF